MDEARLCGSSLPIGPIALPALGRSRPGLKNPTWLWWDSNPRPSDPQSDVLTTALRGPGYCSDFVTWRVSFQFLAFMFTLELKAKTSAVSLWSVGQRWPPWPEHPGRLAAQDRDVLGALHPRGAPGIHQHCQRSVSPSVKGDDPYWTFLVPYWKLPTFSFFL